MMERQQTIKIYVCEYADVVVLQNCFVRTLSKALPLTHTHTSLYLLHLDILTRIDCCTKKDIISKSVILSE